jgi:hypothetical protein
MRVLRSSCAALRGDAGVVQTVCTALALEVAVRRTPRAVPLHALLQAAILPRGFGSFQYSWSLALMWE